MSRRALEGILGPAPAGRGGGLPDARHPARSVPGRVARPRPTAAAARPRPPSGPVIEVTGAPGGVKAKGAVLADTATGQVLWDRDADTERPMASVTKVMTALLVLQSGNPGREIRVPKAAFDYAWKYGGETAALRPGDVLTAQHCWRRCCCLRGRMRRIPSPTPTVPAWTPSSRG